MEVHRQIDDDIIKGAKLYGGSKGDGGASCPGDGC